jgi:hypothetical protein
LRLLETASSRIALFVGANLLFWLLLGVGFSIGGQSNPRILYLVLLFALCSSTLIDLDGLNGRYSLLAIFLVAFFMFYGVEDVSHLLEGGYGGEMESITKTEAVILVGGLMLVLGFRTAVTFHNPIRFKTGTSADWPLRSILIVGIVLWLIGVAATYYWYFFVVKDKSLEGTKSIATLNPWLVAGLISGQQLAPLSTLLITYGWRLTKRLDILALVLLFVAVQVFLGFVIDTKVMALTGGVLVILTIVFAEGRISKLWVGYVIVFVFVAFPVFQAYRAVVGGGDVSRVQVLENFAKTFDAVLAAEDKANSGRERAQTFFERLSMKDSVRMIVQGTENGVPFQHGYTLTPIIASFVPRIIWSDKPDVPVGRMVNKAFHVTEQEETYISPSHLGDLYWNFAWPGVIVGMALIGALAGFISRFNLREHRSVTRLLVMALTVEFMIHGFEGGLAASYVVWLRCMAAVGLMHLVFARKSVRTEQQAPRAELIEAAAGGWVTAPKFPNLLS